MKIIRWAGWIVGGIIVLLIAANLSARGYQAYRAWSLSRAFAARHPDIQDRTPADRLTVKAAEILSSLKTTRYDHFTSIDESAGEYFTDCSGLACYLLRNAAPESYRTVSTNWYAVRPQASRFYQAFESAPETNSKTGWQKIDALIDARPGDFIAWFSRGHRFWENTGHIVMVLETPVQEEGDTVRVRVLESGGGRRIDDTNEPGVRGVGAGTMRITVDESGALKGNGAIGRPVDPSSGSL